MVSTCHSCNAWGRGEGTGAGGSDQQDGPGSLRGRQMTVHRVEDKHPFPRVTVVQGEVTGVEYQDPVEQE